MRTVQEIPGLKDILDDCEEKVSALIGKPVKIHFSMRILQVTTKELIEAICDVCEVPWERVLSGTRKADVVIARQFFCYFSVSYQKKTLKSIATIINRDHTTVIHSNTHISDMIDSNDILYMPLFMEIDKRLQGLLNQPIVQVEQPKTSIY